MLSWEYPPHLVGGLGAHVAELVPALTAAGVSVTLLTPRWKGGAPVEPLHDDTVVYRVDPPVARPSNYYADAQQTNLTLEMMAHQLIEQGGTFDLIHAHDWLVSFAAEALKKMYKTPLIATIHATERGRGRGMLHGDMAQAINGAEWWLTYEAWRVIATSHFMANEIVSYFELPRDKIVVIPNGVNPARFAQLGQPELTAFRAGWALPDERLIFYIGRIQHEKGVHWLIEAAAQLLSQGERIKLVIAGTGSLLSHLRYRVAALGLADRILLPGYIEDSVRDRLYCVADVAVFPSLYEPFGIVALEAMAAQCPVIVSDVGGLGEVVEHQVTGLKIPPDDLEAIKWAIQEVLHNPGAARTRAERAYQVVCREYSWDHIARAKLEVYKSVLEARRITPWE